jgi:BirA family biotin operon repressor/biotin-[acetyl-CoA-carboxylase] ligase
MNATSLQLLHSLAGGSAVSGVRLAAQQGCSRAAIWKQVQDLRDCGIAISAVAGQGYQWQHAAQLLDVGSIMSQLTATAAERLQQLHCLPSCGSTSAVLAQQQQPGNSVCVTEFQTGGRGRRGRQWLAPAGGSLLLSMRWEFNTGAGALGLLGIRTGLLLRDMLQQFCSLSLGLKWPNDVVVSDQGSISKLAGILIELQGGMDGPCTAIIGVGVNVNWPADYLHMTRTELTAAEAQAYPPVDLNSLTATHADAPAVSRNLLAALLINRLVAMCQSMESSPGTAVNAQIQGQMQGQMQGSAATLQAPLKLVDNWREHDVLYGHKLASMLVVLIRLTSMASVALSIRRRYHCVCLRVSGAKHEQCCKQRLVTGCRQHPHQMAMARSMPH